jgi:hypothetical protein
VRSNSAALDNLTYVQTFSRDDVKSLVLVVLVDSTLSLSVEVETQTIVLGLPKLRRVLMTARAASDSRETIDTSVQWKVNAGGSTLVLDIEEEETHAVVLGGVVVSGEVAALGKVDALVLGAELLQSVFGEGDLDGC